MTDSLFGVIWLLTGIGGAMLATSGSKDSDACGWFLMGMLLGPTTLLAVLVTHAVALCRRPGPSLHIIRKRRP